MSKEISGYQAKRRKGLVPSNYDSKSREFQLGAWKHWPKGMPDDSRAAVALLDTFHHKNFDRGYHRFTEPYVKNLWFGREA